ncbi:MAG: STAS domain-containing protein [Pseudomonadota bacterium]
MEFKLEQVGDVTVAHVCVEFLNAGNVQDFKSEMAKILKPGSKVVLEMSRVKFVDSSGIGGLLSCVNNLSSANTELRISNVTIQVRNLFDLVRVDRFLNVFNTSEEAVRSF